MKNNILTVLFVVITVLFFQRECSRPEPIVMLEPVFIYDTTEIVNIVTPDPVETILPGDTIYTVDTVFINDGSLPIYVWDVIEAHFSRNFYKEIVMDDSSAYLRLNLEIYTNNLESLTYSFINRRPIDIDIPDFSRPRNKLFIGGTVSGNLNQFGAGPSAALLTKRDGLYSYNYDIINKVHSVSMFYKLSFK